MVSRETLLLEVTDVTKLYDNQPILKSLSLHVYEGELLGLLGPSGSGKSTLLRCIAGLERLDGGRIVLRGMPITHLPPHQRGIGMMFQQFALFPHRTVEANIAFGLKMQGVSAAEQRARTDEMLALVGLQGYGQRSIFELSGGEQQRVALARSLAPRPRLLMLDEPLGALDHTLRERLMDEVRAILKRIGMTALYVTHDQQEAFAMSDRLVLMDKGELVQEGTPETLYRQPRNRFVAGFFGLHNILPIHTVRPLDGPHRWQVHTALGDFEVHTTQPPTSSLLIRPEAATLAATEPLNSLPGTVRERLFRGTHYRVGTEHKGETLEWELPPTDLMLPPVGQPITLFLRPDALTFLND